MSTSSSGPLWKTRREALSLFARGVTVRTALPTALIVGTILSAVNQAEVIGAGDATAGTWIRVGVNYLIPFLVASIGFLSARRARV